MYLTNFRTITNYLTCKESSTLFAQYWLIRGSRDSVLKVFIRMFICTDLIWAGATCTILNSRLPAQSKIENQRKNHVWWRERAKWNSSQQQLGGITLVRHTMNSETWTLSNTLREFSSDDRGEEWYALKGWITCYVARVPWDAFTAAPTTMFTAQCCITNKRRGQAR